MTSSVVELRALRHPALAVLLLLSLFACSDRSRQNPFDPQNPNTQGKPVGLTLAAVLDTIRFGWQPMSLQDLTGYEVQRELAGETEFSALAEVPASTNQYLDRSNHFGVLHSYRIVAKVGDLSSAPSEVVTITPGPTLIWIADVNDGSLLKLTHDGRYPLLRSFAFPSPLRVQGDYPHNNVWVLDQFLGNLGRINQGGGDRQTMSRVGRPVDLVVDDNDGSVWVADTLGVGLQHFDTAGNLLAKNEMLPKLAAVAWNPFFNELWAVTQDGHELLRISKQAALLQRVALPVLEGDTPRDLAVHAGSGLAWLALSQRVVRLDATGQFLASSVYAFRRALRVAVDPHTAECWVIDESFAFRESTILKLDAQAAVQIELPGFDRPQNLAVNSFDSSCFVVDTLRGRVVRISPQGEMQTVYGGLITPIDLTIVNVRR